MCSRVRRSSSTRAAGGLGSIAVQLAKALGAHVATTVSTAKVDLAKDLGADVVVDYRTQDFEEVLDGYDVVLDSLGGENLAKSLRVLKPGGMAISVAGPPDPAFARELGVNPILRLAMTALSFKTRRSAKRHGVTYSFLFMKASGDQLRELTPSSTPGRSAPSSTASSRSKKPSRPWSTSKRDGQRQAKSSSR